MKSLFLINHYCEILIPVKRNNIWVENDNELYGASQLGELLLLYMRNWNWCFGFSYHFIKHVSQLIAF